jgi:transposase
MGSKTIKKGKVTFKKYEQNQMLLFPPSLEDLIPEKHLVRIVNEIIDQINLKKLENYYPGGGASAYHPKMMLKILVYGYSNKIYTSRKIEASLGRDIHFMWLSGMQKPDFRTINDFRKGVLKDMLDELFTEVLYFLIEGGYIKLENYFADGTKLRADSNKFSYIWSKNTDRYRATCVEKIKVLLKEIEIENDKEEETYGESNLEEQGGQSNICSDDIKKKSAQLNQILSAHGREISDKDKKKLIRKNNQLIQLANKLEKYEDQEKILAGRSSYSRTDTDATFMRLKDGQLLPAYNILNGTENQFIINYTIGQNANEAVDFITHMNKLQKLLKILPKRINTDALFGSEENYKWMEENNIENYMKYSGYYYENSEKYKNDAFNKDKFVYDTLSDSFVCPNNKKLYFIKQATKKSKTGFISQIDVYQCEDCQGCQLTSGCLKGNSNRTIQFSREFERYKAQAKTNLDSDIGIKLRKQRGVDVETPFGNIKHNMGFRRFNLRGIKKVYVEWGLLCLAHNLNKVAVA